VKRPQASDYGLTVDQHVTARVSAAIACFQDDLDALLAGHRVPARHRIRVRTTNLAERSFIEERRRSKVIRGSRMNARR
jgi:putative transposase